MSDVHIGAFRQPELRGLVVDAFEAAIDRCMEEEVSFVLLSGDIFDSNIPDLASVRRGAKKIKEAVDSGIRFYAIYGSHDFSPNYASIVDVLNGAGLFTRAEAKTSANGKVILSFVQDPSGAKICGLSGRKLSIDREEYAMLDRDRLEREPGLKIFMFHGAIDELKPLSLEKMEGMPADSLPAGFDYYAGGHVHHRTVESLPGRRNIAYPGPLFATDYTELLQMAQGGQRGFNLIEFDDGSIKAVEFVPIKVCDVAEVHYSANGKTSGQAAQELIEMAGGTTFTGKVVLLTVEGELSDGKTSDIDFFSIRKRLMTSEPLVVLANYSKLTSRQLTHEPIPPKPVQVTERELFEREVANVKSEETRLRGKQGVELALTLLRTLKEGKRENENKREFEERTAKAGFSVLGLGEP